MGIENKDFPPPPPKLFLSCFQFKQTVQRTQVTISEPHVTDGGGGVGGKRQTETDTDRQTEKERDKILTGSTASKCSHTASQLLLDFNIPSTAQSPLDEQCNKVAKADG